MRLSHRDQILLQRFFDGELNDVEAAALQTRLAAEPALQQGLDELERVRSGFVADRESSFAAPAGFTAGVLAEVRQLPNRIELEQAERTGVVLVTCRRVLLAAAILFGLGLCWHAGLLDGDNASTLEAAPDEIQREMERLDEDARSLPPRPPVTMPERPR